MICTQEMHLIWHSDAEATKLDERVQTGYSWEKQPYPSYILSGNTAEMRRLRQRI